MALTSLSVDFRSAKVTVVLQSKRRHCGNKTCKMIAIGRTPCDFSRTPAADG